MIATGIGSFPGTSQHDYDEALRCVIDELGGDEHGMAFIPEVPGRGAPAGMIGRTLGLFAASGVWDADLQPEGWRLTGTLGAPPIDQRRARSLIGQDLDAWEERTAGMAGAIKTQIAGPWTLSAAIERPRGDKIVADHGARRDLAQGLAAAVGDHVADVRRRTPGAERVVVQIDEPGLPAVMAGRIPTASGFGRHRVVHPPEVAEALAWVTAAIRDAGGEPWVHCCASDAPIGLLRGAGAVGIAVDLALVDGDGLDALAEALEAGTTVALGLVPSLEPTRVPTDSALAERALRWLEMVGLDPVEQSDSIAVTSACGLAGASTAWAKRAVRLSLMTTKALADASHS